MGIDLLLTATALTNSQSILSLLCMCCARKFKYVNVCVHVEAKGVDVRYLQQSLSIVLSEQSFSSVQLAGWLGSFSNQSLLSLLLRAQILSVWYNSRLFTWEPELKSRG